MYKTLVLCDDPYHPAATARAGLAPLAGGAFAFDFCEDGARWAAGQLSGCALVILARSNHASAANPVPWVTAALAEELAAFVRAGGGLLAVHSGTAGYGEVPALRALLGGVFDHHPPQCPVTVAARPGFPLSPAVTQFTCLDEHYHMLLDDPQARVFMTTASAHGEQPGGWTRAEGQGRVCVLTPGHNLAVWLEPALQTLLRAALLWCAQADSFLPA